MTIQGWLKLNSNTGRAELSVNGETFSFPARLASHKLTLTVPDSQHRQLADPLTAAGASMAALRGVGRMSRGRAELALASGEVVSLPARFAGQLVGIDVLDLVQVQQDPQVQQVQLSREEQQVAFFNLLKGGGGDREALSIPHTEDDLDVLGPAQQ